jgi:WD40 repeat protein
MRHTEFSPREGRLLATDDRRVRLWETDTTGETSQPLQHPATVMSAEFSPDGGRVITTCGDGYVRLWEAATGKLLVRWFALGFNGQHSPLMATERVQMPDELPPSGHLRQLAAVCPSGQFMAATLDECTVHFWEPGNTGARQRRGDLIVLERSVRTLSFSPDGRRLLIWLANGTARIWDIRFGNARPVPLPVATPLIRAHFQPDGQQVMTLEASGFLRHWDARSRRIWRPATRLGDSVRIAEFSENGRWVATVATNQAIRLWDTRTGDCLAARTDHPAPVTWLRLSPDGEWVAAAHAGGVLRLWDTQGSPNAATFIQDDGVVCAQFSPDSQSLVIVSTDGSACVRSARTGQLRFPALRDEAGITFAGFTPDGQRLLTTGVSGTVHFWDAQSGLSLATLARHADGPLMVRVNPQGTLLATVASDTTFRVCELPTGRILFTSGRQLWPAADLQFTPEGHLLVMASADGRLRFWDARTGLQTGETSRTGGRLQTLQIGPGCAQLLTICPNAALLWDGPVGPAAPPAWLAPLAEAVGGRRFNPQREFERVPVRELLAIKRAVRASGSADPYTRWARWFFADRFSRPQSPEATCTVEEHVERLIQQGTTDALREALRYSPTNRAAFSQLARILRAQNTNSNAVLAAEADWCDRKANEPNPR